VTTSQKGSTARRPGLVEGPRALAFGLSFLLREPRLLGFALVPALVFLVLSSAALAASFMWIRPLVLEALPEATSHWGRFGVQTIAWLSSALVGAFGFIVALALTPPLSSPALERLVRAVEAQLGAPEQPALGFFAEMWCGLRAVAFATMFVVPLELLLWLADLFVPGAIVITLPLKLLVASFGVAWNLVDYPLTLRGVRMRRRLELVVANARPLLGFGAVFAMLFWLPCCGILLLPVGVIAATRLVWTLPIRQTLSHDSIAIPS
jgi:CysZ protein